MEMDKSTFQYLRPTEKQMENMLVLRDAFANMCKIIEEAVPNGKDRDHAIRLLRSAGMWCNVAITRQEDGFPRNPRSLPGD